MSPHQYLGLLLGLATGTALLGVFAGVFYASSQRHLRAAIPLSAGLLLGVALFGLLPEIAQDLSWSISLLCFAGGFLVLTGLDHLGVSICANCAHDHDHHRCSAPLHGFAIPLLVAAGVHSLLDGWAIATSGLNSTIGVRLALPLALVLHKLPEGLALGGMLNPALRSRWSALAWAAAIESLTVLGGAIALVFGPRPGSAWTTYPLAVAGGFFLFLGFHALHGEWKKRPRSTLLTGFAGIAFSAVLQTGLRSFLGL